MRKPTKREAIIGGISLAITVALSLLILQHKSYIEELAHWGYIGCFIISVLTNGTFILPGFGIVLTFTLGGVLNPAIVGAVAGIGEAIGAIGAYFTGYAGRGLLRDSNNGLYLRFSNIVERHGSKAIFFRVRCIESHFLSLRRMSGHAALWLGKIFPRYLGREDSQKHGAGLSGLLRFEGCPTMAGSGPLT